MLQLGQKASAGSALERKRSIEMKNLSKIGAIVGLSLVLAGCSAMRDWLIDPKTAQAAKIVGAGVHVAICQLAKGAQLALAVEQAGNLVGQTATNVVLAASATVCASIGGEVTGSAVTAIDSVVVTGDK